jgi:cytochrome d ubiquinol oxidase subunit II
LSVTFFVPLHLALVGIILRGAAFVFRAHGATVERPNPFWTQLFGAASAFTPLILGLCLAAITSGRLRFTPGARMGVSGFWEPWLSPFAWSLGLFALAICAYLAAVYLTLETEGELQEDFRRRALGAGVAMAALAVLTLGVAWWDAPRFWSQMLQPRAAPVLAGAGLLGLASTAAVLRRGYARARIAAAGQVVLVVLGWGIAQHPYLIYPDFPLSASAAPEPTLRMVLWSLVPGGLLLGPSLWLLFRVFKGNRLGVAP